MDITPVSVAPILVEHRLSSDAKLLWMFLLGLNLDADYIDPQFGGDSPPFWKEIASHINWPESRVKRVAKELKTLGVLETEKLSWTNIDFKKVLRPQDFYSKS